MNMLKKLVSIVLTVTMLSSSCLAYTLNLPSGITRIEEEAFYGDTSLDEVRIPSGAEIIGDRAFAESSVSKIYIPETVQYIGQDAIPDTATIYAPGLSYAKEYAQEHHLNAVTYDNLAYVEYGTVYIGENAYSGIQGIYIPDTVEEIAENAFTDLPNNFTIYASEGSVAYDYARNHQFVWKESGNYYLKYTLEDLKELLESEEATETEPIEDYDIFYYSLDEFDDPVLLQELEELNALQAQLASSELSSAVEQLDEQLAGLQSCMDSDVITVTDEGISVNVNGRYYNANILGADLISENSEIVSVQSSRDDKSILITSKNENGELVYIHSDENGMSISNTNIVPRSSSYGMITRRAAENQASFLARLADTVISLVDQIEGFVLVIDANVESLYDAAENGWVVAKYLSTRALELSQRYPKIESFQNAAQRFTENVIKADKKMAVVEKLSGVWKAFSKAFDILSFASDMTRLKRLIDIQNHNHPTAEDMEDYEKYQIADQLLSYIVRAEVAIVLNITYSALDLFNKIDPVLIAMSAFGGPVGLGVKFVVTQTLKAAALTIIKQVAKMGLTYGLDYAADKSYEIVMDTDKLLHEKATPSPTPTSTPAVTPTAIPTPTATPTTTPTTTPIPTPSTPTPVPKTPTPSPAPTSTSGSSGSGTVIIDGDIPIDAAHFPDPVFREYVKRYDEADVPVYDEDGKIKNYVKDGALSLAERLSVRRMSPAGGITSLLGIKYFHNVLELYCSANNITILDVSGCTSLRVLYCFNNQMTSLNVSGCTSLEGLLCADNQLTSLNVSGCTRLESLYCSFNQLTSLNTWGCSSLKRLDCSNNQLTSLDVNGQASLESLLCADNQLTSLNVSGCTSLSVLDCSNNQLTSLDVSGCISLDNLHYKNNLLTNLNVSGCTSLISLNCEKYQLTSLDASGCTSLRDLNCNDNQLTSLDVSGCISLYSLHYENNPLMNLNVSGCTSLTSLNCEKYQLTSLDVSGCTSLEDLDCSDNQLTSLDVSSCASLHIIDCCSNQLISLDVSGCTGLTFLACSENQLTSLNVSGNKSLTHLFCSENQLTSLNVSGYINLIILNCWNNQMTNLDVSNCASLESLNCENNQLMSLDTSGITSLKSLICRENQITSLNASGCTSLEYLVCDYKQLVSLDISSCTSLTELHCNSGHLIKLKATGCTNMIILECADNQLMTLDLSGCENLRLLNCNDNQLINLTLTGCNNLLNMNCANNQLKSLNGRSKLISLDCSNNRLTTLNVLGCAELNYLQCANNQLKKLNVSGCRNLTWLYCAPNPLTNLNVSGCTCLKELYCDNISLTSLNVNGCTGLTKLFCTGNQLKNLNVSNLVNLTNLSCDENQLTSLNVSGLTNLHELSCRDNQLTDLTVSGLSNLYQLDCRNNLLTTLNLTGCSSLTNLYCSGNQLTAINGNGTTITTYDVDPNVDLTIMSGYCGANGNNLTYELKRDILTISGTGAMQNYGTDPAPWSERTITNVVLNEGVTSVGNYAFSSLKDLQSVTLPDSLISIGSSAFYGCWDLKSIRIPKNVTAIAAYAFGYNYALTTVEVAEQNSAFTAVENVLYSKDLTTLVFCSPGKRGVFRIPESVTVINPGAFHNCSRLTEVIIPENVTQINRATFGDCYQLKVIQIPQSVEVIQKEAFIFCDNLQYVYYQGNVDQWNAMTIGENNDMLTQAIVTYESYDLNRDVSWSLENGILTVSGEELSLPVPWDNVKDQVQTVILQEGATSIVNSIFEGHTNLRSVNIPASVTRIGGYVFSDCENLTEIKVASGNTTYSDIDGVLFLVEGACLIQYPAGKSGSTYTVPNNVTDLFPGWFWEYQWDDTTYSGTGGGAFRNAKHLSAITIPNRVTSIPSSTFYGCENLNSVTIPASVTEIGGYAFGDCWNLENVIYSGTKAQWKEIAVANGNDMILSATVQCSDGVICPFSWSLENGVLTISGSEMPDYSYEYNNIYEAPWYEDRENIVSVVLADGLERIGNNAFYDCYSVSSVNIPDSVKSIGDMAFYFCTSLADVTIPQSVLSIGYSAFDHCTSLTSIVIPASVTEIGNYVFADCTSLTEIHVASGNTNYSDIEGVLFRDNGTVLIQYPAGSTRIAYEVPNSVTTLSPGWGVSGEGWSATGGGAFRSAVNLREVTIPETVHNIPDSTFYDCAQLTSVSIPASVTEIGSFAFYGCENLGTIHYGGSLEQWEGMTIGSSNDALGSATVAAVR